MMAPTAPATADDLQTVMALSADTGIPYQTLVGWIRTGVAGHRMRCFRRGRLLFVRPSWLASFVEATNRDT